MWMIENLRIAMKKNPGAISIDNTEFDENRAYLTNPDLFPRFRIENYHNLEDVDLDDEEHIIVARVGEHSIGVLSKQMAYHHVAQGEIDGEHFVIAFCIVCHSAMGIKPELRGKLMQFSVGGLYDGLAVLIDDDTRTYWEHISGKALHGTLKGEYVETFHVEVTTVAAARIEHPDLKIAISQAGLAGKVSMKILNKDSQYFEKGAFPPGFSKTMRQLDDRLEPFTAGLGVIGKDEQRFFPLDNLRKADIISEIDGRDIVVSVNELSKVPYARYVENNERPHQIFSRWYGFSYTYPRTKIAINSKELEVNDKLY